MLKDAVSEMPFVGPLILRFWELQISLLRHNFRSYLLYAVTEVDGSERTGWLTETFSSEVDLRIFLKESLKKI